MDDMKKYLDELTGVGKGLTEDKGKEKRKLDTYDEYALLLNKKKKKKVTPTDKTSPVAENVDVGTKVYDILDELKLRGIYIYNDSLFLKEHVYGNWLLHTEILLKKEEMVAKKIKDQKKLLESTEELDRCLKIYDPNNNYPPIYIRKKSEEELEKEKEIEELEELRREQLRRRKEECNIRRNNEEFRKLLERLMEENKEEEELLKEKKRKEEKRKAEEELVKELNANITVFERDAKIKKQKVNLIEKYRSKFFSELLTEENINREVLLWLKKWTEIIKKESTPQQGNKEDRDKEKEKKEEYENAQFPRILLLGGSAGKGKTTLAYVVANHFKFNVVEINGSDDRNKDTLIPLIESAVCMHSIGSKNNLCIIDEIDGMASSQQNINCIMKFLNKKVKNRSIIRRPIICICNDIYHKSLKELRKISKVVIVDSVNEDMLKSRIHYICEKENIKMNSDAVTKLIHTYKGDIRCILNTINFLSKGLRGTEDTSHVYTPVERDKSKEKVSLTLDLLNSYLFFKDANNNYMELLNMIYVKNKSKTHVKNLLKECHKFFYNNLANEYNYSQSYYYIFDNLIHIPFTDSDFSKLSYCLDFMCFCDFFEYRQSQHVGGYQKFLFYMVYLLILVVQLNTNVHVQYVLMHNSPTSYTRKKQMEIKRIKENFVNDKFGLITYKYIYSKNFFFETINYIFSFFFVNEFFFKNVQLWAKHSYYKGLDIPKFILVPFENKQMNKFQGFVIKLLYIMTLFNISFTAISSSSSMHHTYKNYKTDATDETEPVKKGGAGFTSAYEKSYVFDPLVEDFLLFTEKKQAPYLSHWQQKGNNPTVMHTEAFPYKRKKSFLNSTICESLNDLKMWVNNNITIGKGKGMGSSGEGSMEIISSSTKAKTTKASFNPSYTTNFEISLADIIVLTSQESFKELQKKYLEELNISIKESGKNGETKENEKKDYKSEQVILKTKILYKNEKNNSTIFDLLKEEQEFMLKNIKSDEKIYYSGKYVKTNGYYKNVEERCNAVLQPLNFSIYS